MTKNIVAFVILSVVVIVGWSFLQRQIWPPKPVDPNKLAQAKDAKKDKDVPPKANDKDEKKGDEKKIAEKKVEEKKADEKKADPKIVDEKQIVIPAPDKVRTFELGDDASYLKLVITNRGAGVQRLTLTKFQAADYLGRPEKVEIDGKRVERQLEFIQDDPFVPSFLMGVYGDAADGTKFQPKLGEQLWNAVTEVPEKEGDVWKLAFWTQIPGQENLKVVKTYRLSPVEYHVRLSVEIQNADKDGKSTFRYQLTGAHGLPVEGEWYTPPTSIRTSVIGKLDDRDNLYRKQEDAPRIVDKKDADGNPNKQGTKETGDTAGPIQYAGVMTQYFASVVLPDPKQPGGDWRKVPNVIGSASPTVESEEVKVKLGKVDGNEIDGYKIAFTHVIGKNDLRTMHAWLLPRAVKHHKELKLKEGDACVLNLARNPVTNEAIVQWFRLGTTPLQYLDDLTVRVGSDQLTLAAGEKVTHNYWLYHGPVKTRLLGQMGADEKVSQKLVDEYTYTLHLNTLTDYHSDTTIGYFFSKIGWTWLLIACTNLMHTLLYYLHFISFGSWGFSIILLTIVVRGAMYPISRRQAIMSQKMQALAPEIKKMQEKHKDDKAGQAQATMELYRKHKVSPAGGCLPLLLQMPIFMGLYYCLQESVQFRLGRFFWIENLAAPDMTIWWGQGIPWISDPNSMGGILYLGPYFNLLPIIAVAFMVVQQKMMTPPPQNEEQEVQQKTMRIMMGVMGIFFYKVAAGLCLYFIASSVWGVVERKMLPKKAVSIEISPVAAKTIVNSRDRRRDRDKEKDQPETAVSRIVAWWRKLLESAEKK